MTQIPIIFITLSLWTLAQTAYNTPSQNLSFTLNSNLIINPNISSPTISPSSFLKYSTNQSGWTTSKQYVKYVDACLQQYNDLAVCSFQGITCGWQFLGTDSGSQNEQYYQVFTLTAGRQFQLKFDWTSEIPPTLFLLTISSGFQVLWNGDTVFSQYDGSCTLFTSTFYVTSQNGVNELVIGGLGTVDGYGILVRNIKLQEVIYATNNSNTNNTTNNTNNSSNGNTNTTNNSTNNNSNNSTNNSTNNTTNNNTLSPGFDPFAHGFDFKNLEAYLNSSEYQAVFKVINFIKDFRISKAANTIFASKQNVKFLLGFILEFNHLLLYNYHLLNCTIMSNIILVGVQTLDDQKGEILDSYIYPFLRTSPNDIEAGFEQQNTLPVNVNNLITSLNTRPSGMLLDIMDTLWLDLPITIVTFIVGYSLFRLLFKSKISLIFRQYSILGCFLCIILDGKIQMATFYFLSSTLLLKSTNFCVKMQTVAIVFYYFGVFMMATALTTLYRAFYGKLLKYVYDNCKQPHGSAVYMWMNFGLYNLLLGFAHRLLLTTPLLQLYVLIIIQAGYLVFLFTFLLQCRFESLALGAALCAMNFTRLVFILSFLAFVYHPERQYEISLIQEYSFFLFIALWILSSLLCFIEKIGIIYDAITYECRKGLKLSKVAPAPPGSRKDGNGSRVDKGESSIKSRRLGAQKVNFSTPTSFHIINFEQQEVSPDLKKRLKSSSSAKMKQLLENQAERNSIQNYPNNRKTRKQQASRKVKFMYKQA